METPEETTNNEQLKLLQFEKGKPVKRKALKAIKL